ncbi:MAG: phosphodiester glycosidase family protein [Parcubacteria group bacterium]|nr:phosphodiester glycosidase family protein [Parcubacteria group bacterium]
MKRYYILLGLLALLGASCQPANTFPPTATVPQNEAPVSGWQTLSSGLERRVFVSPDRTPGYEFVAYRLNNKLFQMDLAYSQEPKRLEDWHDQEQSILTINGGYFTEDWKPTGLFVDEGKKIGNQVYDLNRSGTVAIENGRLRFLSSLPGALGKQDVFQSFPLLVKNGQAAVSTDSEQIARRTVIGQDLAGRVLIIVVDKTPLTLFALAKILAESDLTLVNALNLDGGPSTGLIYDDGQFSENLLSLSALPIVLTVTRAPLPDAPNGR